MGGEGRPLSHQAGKPEWDTCRVAFLRDPELRERLPCGCKVNGKWTSEEALQIGRAAEGIWKGTDSSRMRWCCDGDAWIPAEGCALPQGPLSDTQEGSWLCSLGEALRKHERAKGLSGLEC